MMGRRSINDFPDDLLRRVLLRLDSSLWLIRAACVCKQWRRAVTDGSDEGRAFLRLARSLHPPVVVGQYHTPHRFVPSSSSPIDGSRISVDDFRDKYPSVADCQGGLVLLRTRYGPCASPWPNLVVYDPLTRKRRWMSRPRPPNKQAYGVRDAFLLDGDDGHISVSNYRLLYWLHGAAAGDPQTCVFSTANGGKWKWLFSTDVNAMETYRQTRNFTYTLPWPQFLRACP